MLRTYADSYCNVYSGLALINREKKQKLVCYERTKILFGPFPEKEMKSYLKSGDWKSRSGAITIETAAPWVRRIEGEYWNVVGLPIDRLKKYLKKCRLV